MTQPNHEARKLARLERERLMRFWHAQQNRPRFDGVSKKASKTLSGKQGFHSELYISRRGFSKYGTPPEKI